MTPVLFDVVGSMPIGALAGLPAAGAAAALVVAPANAVVDAVATDEAATFAVEVAFEAVLVFGQATLQVGLAFLVDVIAASAHSNGHAAERSSERAARASAELAHTNSFQS